MDINDLYAAQKIKQSNKMEFFNSILQKCHHRIKTVAQKSETFCFYIVPEFSLGTPLYNVYQCYHSNRNIDRINIYLWDNVYYFQNIETT